MILILVSDFRRGLRIHLYGTPWITSRGRGTAHPNADGGCAAWISNNSVDIAGYFLEGAWNMSLKAKIESAHRMWRRSPGLRRGGVAPVAVVTAAGDRGSRLLGKPLRVNEAIMNRTPAVLCLTLLVAVLPFPYARASVFYDVSVAAISGENGITAMEDNISMNDFGRIAVVGHGVRIAR